MKTKVRPTARREYALRITTPEYRKHPDDPTKKILFLGWVDGQGNQRRARVIPQLFVYAAGTNAEGEVSGALDRETKHNYIIHLDDQDTVVGLDAYPSRIYRGGVVLTKERDVDTIRISIQLDGAVYRVERKPPRTRPEVLRSALEHLDKMVRDKNGAITSGVRLGQIGRIITAGEGIVEVRPNAAAGARVAQTAGDDFESIAESAE